MMQVGSDGFSGAAALIADQGPKICRPTSNLVDFLSATLMEGTHHVRNVECDAMSV
jgi:hypothetical protein